MAKRRRMQSAQNKSIVVGSQEIRKHSRTGAESRNQTIESSSRHMTPIVSDKNAKTHHLVGNLNNDLVLIDGQVQTREVCHS